LAGCNEKRAQSQHEALERREIWHRPSISTDQEQLLLHERIFCHQPTHATRLGQSGKHHDEVDQKDQETFHRGAG
jgi:hypothetical protein